MRVKDKELNLKLHSQLEYIKEHIAEMPGLDPAGSQDVFVHQLIDSIRRIYYVLMINRRPIANERANPHSTLFDPLKAAVLSKQAGNIEEAFWLTFLAIHFGKSKETGWVLAKDIYGGLNEKTWSWKEVSEKPEIFKTWLSEKYPIFVGDGTVRKFGNHRKYETLKPDSERGTGNVIGSYIKWVKSFGSHGDLIENTSSIFNKNPRLMFEYLYKSMDEVISFGRTAKFDYLTMLTKLHLAQLEPNSIYVEEATGPRSGAKLLFGGSKNTHISNVNLNKLIASLDTNLTLGILSMQVLEDALCNWQKSPVKYKYFAG